MWIYLHFPEHYFSASKSYVIREKVLWEEKFSVFEGLQKIVMGGTASQHGQNQDLPS